jgi:hypothetical protein
MFTRSALTLAALACGLLAGCNKPADTDGNNLSASAAPTEFKTPSQEVLDRSTMLTATPDAKDPSKSDHQEIVKLVQAALIKEIEGTNFKLDEKQENILHIGEPPHQASLDRTAIQIASKLAERGTEVSQVRAETAAQQFYRELTELIEAQVQEAEIARKSAGTGRYAETMEGQELPDLRPSTRITGKWKSIREENLATAVRVNHTVNYHQLLEIREDKTLTWIYYRNGTEFSNDTYEWSYDEKTGALQLSYPKGDVFQTLSLFDSKNEGGVLYIQTPDMDMLKVFERI